MDGAFWWGLAAAVPVGIATNLVTPIVQRKLAVRSSAARERQERRRAADQQFITALASNPGYYSSWLSAQTSRQITHLVILTVLLNVPFYVSGVSFYDYGIPLGEDMYLPYQLVYVAIIVAVTTTFAVFLNVRRKINQVTKAVAEQNVWNP